MTYDPPRLKDSADISRELGAALDALRRGPGDAARVGRVAAKLGPLLDAAPPPAPAALPPRLPRIGLHTLKAARLFVAGMAVGASVLWLSRWQREPAAPPQPAARAAVSASETSLPPSTSAAAAHAERLTLSNDEGGNPTSAAPLPEDARSQRSEPSRTTLPATSSRASRQGAARTRMAPSAARAGSVGASGPQASSVEESAPLAHPPREPEPPAAQPDPPKGEVELLFEARTLRQRAPRAALALLDQHAVRFPSGMLAPEREAMAIEILRTLGWTQQADARLARYRAHYPNSLHLPRLEKGR